MAASSQTNSFDRLLKLDTKIKQVERSLAKLQKLRRQMLASAPTPTIVTNNDEEPSTAIAELTCKESIYTGQLAFAVSRDKLSALNPNPFIKVPGRGFPGFSFRSPDQPLGTLVVFPPFKFSVHGCTTETTARDAVESRLPTLWQCRS